MIEIRWTDRRTAADRIRPREAGRALLARMLQERGEQPEPLVRAEGGRPVLASGTWQFSIAHTEHLTACAISRENVGLDIEVLRHPRVARLRREVPHRLFTPAEQRAATATEHGVLEVFTRKEAWAKYTGIGLGIGIGRLDTTAPPDGLVLTALEFGGAVGAVCHRAGRLVLAGPARLERADLERSRRLDTEREGVPE